MRQVIQPQSTRRALLIGLAAVPLAPIPVLAGEPDPVFAAIEVHRRARADVGSVRAARKAAQEALGVPGWPNGYMLSPEHKERWNSDAALQVEMDRQQPAFDVEEAAFLAMLSAPGTEAGRLALAAYGCELTTESEGGPVLRLFARSPHSRGTRWYS
jgi:hypothetical protein